MDEWINGWMDDQIDESLLTTRFLGKAIPTATAVKAFTVYQCSPLWFIQIITHLLAAAVTVAVTAVAAAIATAVAVAVAASVAGIAAIVSDVVTGIASRRNADIVGSSFNFYFF